MTGRFAPTPSMERARLGAARLVDDETLALQPGDQVAAGRASGALRDGGPGQRLVSLGAGTGGAFITELKALIERLEGQVRDYRRTKFGPKSENLDPAQLELALEDLETAIAETQAQIAAVEDRIAASEPDPEKRTPRAPARGGPCPRACRAPCA